ncbi:pre-mRNA-processing factor 40 [Cryptococcus wingfieldii CBS 7118]|uniref:Pre-mRNA-processing factor 40 n=1 Tax=Cryptococcus wingfieldii CBS 7118 TaxID=1295528 RepID=A0A1E3IJ41_9TREE|nr:pre-mRNA-processing factor 40 [Cryptococcus wingfieldii CBS 7118]ODN88465.1 pre-mRNA-processing factor 40 [Cryptococcus wingfieldii CBS 7118]
MSDNRSLWSEYKNAEGRVYWSHATTKQSVWEKPDELKTPFEKALAKTQWKQYTSKNRPYYVNSATKETKWDLPAELVTLKAQVEAEEARKNEREARREKGESLSPSPSPRRMSRSPTPEDIRELRASAASAIAIYKQDTSQTASPAAKVDTPIATKPQEDLLPIVMPTGGFQNKHEAEIAFTYLLKREGVNETWTWDQVMRKIVLDPLYNALETLAEKKGVFEKFTNGILEERRAAKEARISRFRPIFTKLFTKSNAIKSYSTLKTADRVFAKDKYWKEALPEEKRLILEEYTDKLRREEEVAERELKEYNVRTLKSLIPTLSITVSTRWRAAHDLIISSPAFRADPSLQQASVLDMIKAYEDYAYKLEQEHKEESRKLRIEDVRRARKAREGYKALLKEMEERGDLKRTSKWRETYGIVKGDPRYEALLGLPGSSPLELWMDAIDDLSEEVSRAAEKIEYALGKAGKEFKKGTTWEELEGWCHETHMDQQISERLRKEVFSLLQSRARQQEEEELRKAERRQRHRIDDLRYALRKVDAINIDMSYEQALPHIKDVAEFKAMESEEEKQLGWEKFVRRQKEKLAEGESSTHHRSDRDHRDRRDRDRDYRSDRDRAYYKTDRMDVDPRERDDGSRGAKRDDRDRDRDRRDRGGRDRERDDRDRRDREYGREKARDKRVGLEDDDRDPKRRRLSSVSSVAAPAAKKDRPEEVEEGEI